MADGAEVTLWKLTAPKFLLGLYTDRLLHDVQSDRFFLLVTLILSFKFDTPARCECKDSWTWRAESKVHLNERYIIYIQTRLHWRRNGVYEMSLYM